MTAQTQNICFGLKAGCLIEGPRTGHAPSCHLPSAADGFGAWTLKGLSKLSLYHSRSRKAQQRPSCFKPDCSLQNSMHTDVYSGCSRFPSVTTTNRNTMAAPAKKTNSERTHRANALCKCLRHCCSSLGGGGCRFATAITLPPQTLWPAPFRATHPSNDSLRQRGGCHQQPKDFSSARRRED